LGSRHEIVIAGCLEVRAGGHCGHLAVANVQQAFGVQDGAHTVNHREVQAIIGSLPSDDIDGQQ
jgi:hypothetical protein